MAVICIVTALTGLLLRRNAPEMALLLTLAAVTAVMLFALSLAGEVRELLQTFGETAGLDPVLFLPVGKIIAISLVTKIGGDICRDSGQEALASAVETVGTLCALAVSGPLLRRMLTILMELGG